MVTPALQATPSTLPAEVEAALSAAQPIPAAPLPANTKESTDIATRIADYRELFKMRVTTMVVITAWTGFYLGSMKSGISSMQPGLIETLVGIGLVSAGSSALNQAVERNIRREDATYRRPPIAIRTHRPRPRHHPRTTRDRRWLHLARATNHPARRRANLLTAFSYVAIYTPLKRFTPLATFIGAFPGAMPPLIGWVAARGVIEWPAVALFAILFVWQFPHFMAIAWLYREDYGRAGIRMLPVVQPDGWSTVIEALVYAVLMIPVSSAPGLFARRRQILRRSRIAARHFLSRLHRALRPHHPRTNRTESKVRTRPAQSQRDLSPAAAHRNDARCDWEILTGKDSEGPHQSTSRPRNF